ncbi:MAG: helix-turn-helix transcriptional regulator [Polyangiaceae bacterium]
MSESDYVTIAEVAKRFRVSKRTVERWVKTGRLPAIQLGERLVRIRQEDVDRLAVAAAKEGSR